MSLQNLQKHIDDVKVLMSNSFRSRSERYLRAVTGDYQNTLVFKPGNVSTDGKVVFADPTSQMLVGLELIKKIIAVRGQVAHEAFHILYTDFSSLKELQVKYNVESGDPIDKFRYFVVKDYLNIIEDSAIELAGSSEFPGLAPYIRLLNETAFEKLPTLDDVEQKGDRLKAHQYACLQYAVIGKVKGTFVDPLLQDLFEQSKPYLDAGRIGRTTKERMENSEAIVDLVKELIEEVIQQGKLKQLENPKGNDMQEDAQGQGRPMPTNQTDWRKQSKKEKQEHEEKQSSSNQKDAEEKDEEENASGSGESNQSKDQSSENTDKKSDGNASESKDNSDDKSSGEKTDSDSDSESNQSEEEGEEEVSKGDSKPNQQLGGKAQEDHQTNEPNSSESEEEDETDELLKELQKEVEKEIGEVLSEMEKEEQAKAQSQKREKMIREHLQGLNYSNHHRNMKVESKYEFSSYDEDIRKKIYNEVVIEIKSVTRNLIKRLQNILRFNDDDKRAGQVSGFLTQSQLFRKDGKIFSQRKDKSDEADLAILVLVDESGSMISDRRYLHARRATIMMAEVCEALKIPFAAIGHTAKYRGNEILHRHFVTFEKPIKEQKHQLVNIAALENTREGVSVKYAGEYLLKQPQKDKLLVVISDGDPFHQAVNGRPFVGDIAKKDAALVVEELEKKGVKTIGVAIGAGQDFIAEIYKNYISIPDVTRLPLKLVSILEKNILKN